MAACVCRSPVFKYFHQGQFGRKEILMSKGPGKIERAIEWMLAANPEMTYTLDELAAAAYLGETNRIEKKHRVATLRAARNVSSRVYWHYLRSGDHGRPLIFYNRLNAASRSIARNRNIGRSHAETAALWQRDRPSDRFGLSDPDWRRTELLRASLEGDDYRQDWLMQEEYAQHKRLAAFLPCQPWDPGEAAWMLTL
ncbi:MAG TPA: hypothetical protein VIU02_09930 [Burkholderiales bacterium]